MTQSLPLRRRMLLAGLSLVPLAAVAACATSEDERDNLVARAEAAREDLFRQVPAA